MKKLGLLTVAIFLFCFGIVVPGCSQGVNSPAPEVTAAKWINTDSFKLADNKDKIVIVEFWATWCPPCRKSIPHLKTLNETYKDQGVIIVSLTDEPAETINEFNKKAGMDWVIGAGSSSGRDYGVSGIPAAFIVVDGKIVWNGHPMGGLDEELKKQVEARAAKAPAPAPAPDTAAPATEVPSASVAPAAPASVEAPVAVETPAEPAEPTAVETPAEPAAPVEAPAASEVPAAPAVEAPVSGDSPATTAPAAVETPVSTETSEEKQAPLGE